MPSNAALSLSSLAALIAGAAPAAVPVAAGSTYVALGSSYAAGTGLPTVAPDSPGMCGQGSANYPRQVARVLDLRLVDRSCGGATMPNILSDGQFGLPAQLSGVDATTRLVTVTIGGNDVRFVADLGRFSCAHRPQDVDEAARPFACAAPPKDFDLERAFTMLERNLRAMVAEVHRRAPTARLVFVDYISLVPAAGTCTALGIDAAEASDLRARAQRLAALTARVAETTGAELVRASAITRGHDVCSTDPWAWGFVTSRERATSGAVGFHPRPQAITAIAKAIVQRARS